MHKSRKMTRKMWGKGVKSSSSDAPPPPHLDLLHPKAGVVPIFQMTVYKLKRPDMLYLLQPNSKRNGLLTGFLRE